MNINIDELISEAEARKKSHSNCVGYSSLSPLEEYFKGRKDESDFWLQKLVALKNEQPEAITEGSHFCKHDVGQSAASSEISNKDSTGEPSSETQAVGQNEQTVKPCICAQKSFQSDCDNTCLHFEEFE